MPVLTYEGLELKPNPRKELIKALTEAACKVSPDILKNTFCIFSREHKGDKMGVGVCTLPKCINMLQKRKNNDDYKQLYPFLTKDVRLYKRETHQIE